MDFVTFAFGITAAVSIHTCADVAISFGGLAELSSAADRPLG